MNRIHLKGILLATLAVLGLDLVINSVLASWFGDIPDRPTDAQVRVALEALYQHPGYILGALTLGSVSTAIGGYLAARLAPQLPYYNALAFGIVYALLGIALGASVPVVPAIWLRAAGTILNILTPLAGAYFYKRQTESGVARRD